MQLGKKSCVVSATRVPHPQALRYVPVAMHGEPLLPMWDAPPGAAAVSLELDAICTRAILDQRRFAAVFRDNRELHATPLICRLIRLKGKYGRLPITLCRKLPRACAGGPILTAPRSNSYQARGATTIELHYFP